jgi:Chalcone isomerase-like
MSVAQADHKFSEIQNSKQFPQNIVIEYNNELLELSLTGLTIRRKYFLDIYSMAHYAQQQSTADSYISENNIYKNILQNNGTKQISMVFLRKLSAKQIQKSLRSGIKSNSNKDEYLEFLPNVEEFMRAIYADVKKNDEFTIRWHPDGTVVSLFQGEQISLIKDKKFAKTLWAIWFGEFSIVNRKALIKELLTSS